MADFPSTLLYSVSGTKEDWRDPVILSVSRANTLRGRRLTTGKKRTFTLSFIGLTYTQKTTLQTHYDAERSNPFSFLWADGVTYTVIYIDEMLSFSPLRGNNWSVTVKLGEV